MSRDDDPNNDLNGDDDPGYRIEWRTVLNWLLLALAVVAILSFCVQKARAQGYLPPERYTQREAPRRQYVAPAPEADPLEYYAEDWVVLNQSEKLVCRDPYIMRDLKVIRCVGTDPVR